MSTLCRGQLRAGLGAVGLALFAVWAVGQILRDRFWLTGLCFYLPSIVVGGLLLPVAALHAAIGGRRRAVGLGVLAAVPLGFVAGVENDFAPKPAAPPGTMRLLHWNTAGRPWRPGILETLLAEPADVYVFTDAASFRSVEVFRKSLPNPDAYESAEFGGLAVVGKGSVRANGWLVERGEFKVQSVTWQPAGRPIELLVVDLPSAITVARDPLLREVNARIVEHRPDLIVGDFNAPQRSRALAELPAGYRHAYHAVGCGWGATWPVPVPVYALDHCLFGPRVVPAAYRLGSGGNSDHRYQVFEFSVPVDVGF